jgi:hypothetical protein
MFTPYDGYLALQFFWGKSETEIIDSFADLRLPFFIPMEYQKAKKLTPALKEHLALQGFVREARERIPQGRVRVGQAPSEEILQWAQANFLDPELLFPNNPRYLTACEICRFAELRHVLQLCLLDRNLTWRTILETVSQYGQIEGLTQEAAQDFQQIFWSFTKLSPLERERYLNRLNPSHGTFLARGGRSQLGLAMDLGLPLEMSDLDRYRYMRDLAFIRYVRGMEVEHISAREASALVEIVLALDGRIREMNDQEMAKSPETFEGEFRVTEERLLSVDDLIGENEDGPEARSVIPLRR